MNCILLIGPTSSHASFVRSFLTDNNIKEVNITKYEITLTVDNARDLKKKLSYIYNENNAVIISGGATLASQNSLLKLIEEANESTYFIFTAENDSKFLPTIRSRCKVVYLNFEIQEPEVESLFKNIENFGFSEIDRVVEVCKSDYKKLLPTFRSFLLSDDVPYHKKHQYYFYCKRLLATLPLIENNNINEKVILENVFLCQTAP